MDPQFKSQHNKNNIIAQTEISGTLSQSGKCRNDLQNFLWENRKSKGELVDPSKVGGNIELDWFEIGQQDI